MSLMNDDVYKLFEILFNFDEWTCREIVLLSIISKEMSNLLTNSSLKINFVIMHQQNNKRFQQIFNSLKRNNLFRNVISVCLFNNGGYGVIEIITDKELNLQNIVSVDIGECNIGKKGAEKIASNIGQCTGLTSLNLSFNDIGTKVAIEFLEKCTGIVSLNLRNNCIRDEEDEEFASKLNCLTRLKKLNLADNCILKPSKFGEALKNLELLNLSGTYFNDEVDDTYNLASILAENTTLIDLNLSGNYIERDAAEHIIFSLNCTNLFSLDLSENQIKYGVKGIVKYCQKKFKALKYLDIDDNMLWVATSNTKLDISL